MKVLRVRPKHYPEVIDIDCSLESLQKEVEGPIQAVYPWDDEVALICNEEGKLHDDCMEKLNRTLDGPYGITIDIIVVLIEPFQRKAELVAQFRNIKGPAAVVGVLCTLRNHVIDDLFYFFSAHNPYSFCYSNIRLSGPVASHAGIEPTVQPMLMTQIKEPQISPGLSCAYSSGVQ